MIQCQMLSEPILQPSKREMADLYGPLFPRKVGPRGVKNKDLSPGKSLQGLRITASVNLRPMHFRN